MRKGECPRADLYISEYEAGATLGEIAEKYGVSRQAVSQAIVKRKPGCFRKYTEKECVYPKLRNYLNENKVTRKAFCVDMGIKPYGENIARLSRYFRGENFPQKETIDKMLKVTGLTYEEFFTELNNERK